MGNWLLPKMNLMMTLDLQLKPEPGHVSDPKLELKIEPESGMGTA